MSVPGTYWNYCEARNVIENRGYNEGTNDNQFKHFTTIQNIEKR